MMIKPVLLNISRTGDSYTFQLEQPELGAAVRQFVTPPISKSDQQRVRMALEQTTRNQFGSYSLEDLGRLLTNLFVPREIQEYLHQLKTSLVIVTNAPDMPWELIYDNEKKQFLGASYSVARLLVTRTEVRSASMSTPSAPSGCLLIAADPFQDLPEIESEIEELHRLIHNSGVATKLLMGNRADMVNVQLEFQRANSYRIVHFAGHANHDHAGGYSFLLLNQKVKLDESMIRQVFRGGTFVFLNGCGTDKAARQRKRGTSAWQATEGLAAAFMTGGARCAIGTRWQVGDKGAARFAMLFYAAALQGVPVGEALRQARVDFAQRWPQDATWAAYVLYGDPGVRLIDTTALYLPDGTLNQGLLSMGSRAAFDQAAGEAARLGHTLVGAPHLFLALIAVPGNLCYQLLSQLGHSPAAIAEQLRQTLAASAPTPDPPALTQINFSARLQQILEIADKRARAAECAQIEESHLLIGLLSANDGLTLNLLTQNGVAVDRLRVILTGGTVPDTGHGATAPAESSLRSVAELPFAAVANRVLAFALAEAQRSGQGVIGTPHLIIGLTEIEGGCMERTLQQQGYQPKVVRDWIRRALPSSTAVAPPAPPAAPISVAPRVGECIRRAEQEARKSGAAEITDCHLLIGFLSIDGSGTYRFLASLGLDLAAMLAAAQADAEDGQLSGDTPLLNRIGRDLTAEARRGRLKPIVGRQRELSRIVQVLARSDKNAPLLIGDAGVGKTALVEGLAQYIVEERVPAELRHKRIIELPISALVAGTKYRGEMEDRLAKVIAEASIPAVIVFLDEVHMLVGGGRAEGSALDVGNILKPALARGEIRCIAATTQDEYQQSIEKDKALARRFQPLIILEPSPQEAVEILGQLRIRYEQHHNLVVTDEAVEAAVNLSVLYLPERHLPDKAHDLLDEACARTRIGSASQWTAGPTPVRQLTVDGAAVAKVVSEWTGIPVSRLTTAEKSALLGLEEAISQRVIGQDAAVQAVAKAIRLARAGLKPINRPRGVFLFAGPSGVGKTLLAKTLAEAMFGSDDALVRLDMSECMEAHSVSKLIGAPPGFVGHESEGQLTGALRRRPYAVVLLDEIEKAHPQVLNVLLQLFDDGRLTDAQGRTANGREAVFIMTSNLGSALVNQHGGIGFRNDQPTGHDIDQTVLTEARKFFLPELLNRLDEILIFRPLGAEQYAAIAQQILDELAARLAQEHGIRLIVESSVIQLFCDASTAHNEGARQLRRLIDRAVTRPLSDLVLSGARGAVVVSVQEDKIKVISELAPEP